MFRTMSDGFDYFLIQRLAALEEELHDFEREIENQIDSKLVTGILAAKRQIYDLNVLVISLVESLAATKVLDLEVLEAQMQKKLTSDGFSAVHPEPLSPDRPYQCLGCYRAIAIAEGNMTANGMRCRTCARW